MFYASFRSNTSVFGKVMPIHTLTKQQAHDVVYMMYGKAVAGILMPDEITENTAIIDFGSDVIYTEDDTVITYPLKFNPYLDAVGSIIDWFKLATPNPQDQNINVQIGSHVEEFREMLAALNHIEPEKITKGSNNLLEVEHMFKVGTGYSYPDLTKEQRITLADSLGDQIVTAIGIMTYLQMDVKNILSEIARSNHSKFEDGKPVRDENLKIIKGKHYTAPDLSDFV